MFSYKDYICAIWNERSFSRASQKLFVSQPWLSSVVKKTEQEIGTPIFDRSTNPISLTEAGRYYLEQAKRITEIEDETRMYFSSLSAKNGASVRVGSSMFFCTYVLPGLMDEFKAMYPQVELTFVEGITKDLTDKLLDHTIDFSLEVEKIRIQRSNPSNGHPRRSFSQYRLHFRSIRSLPLTGMISKNTRSEKLPRSQSHRSRFPFFTKKSFCFLIKTTIFTAGPSTCAVMPVLSPMQLFLYPR